MEKVAALLGHANLNTTRIYIAPGVEDLQEAVQPLGDRYKALAISHQRSNSAISVFLKSVRMIC